MKFTVQNKTISDALKKCSGAMTGRSTLPILSCIQLEAVEDGLRLTSTDLDRWVICSIPAEVTKPGIAKLSFRLLSQILSGPGSASIEIDSKNKALITIGDSRFRVQGLADEFPAPPEIVSGPKSTISPADWISATASVKWAVFFGEGRDILTGVFLDFLGTSLDLIATDGTQLAKATVPTDGDLTAQVVCPAATIEMINSIAAADAPMNFQIRDNLLTVTNGPDVVISKMIEGGYPNYRQVIPQYGPNITRASINCKTTIEALDKVSIVSKDISTAGVTIDIGEDDIEFSLKAEDEATSKMMAGIHGKPVKIKVNPRKLRNPLRTWGVESLELEIDDPLSPICIRHESRLYVVMPMRVA